MAPNQNSDKIKELKIRFAQARTAEERHAIFRELVERLGPLLRAVLSRRCQGREDVVDDLVQEALLRYFAALATSQIENDEAWCIACVKRLLCDLQRREKTQAGVQAQSQQNVIELGLSINALNPLREALQQARWALKTAQPQRAEQILRNALCQAEPVSDDTLNQEIRSTVRDVIVMIELDRLPSHQKKVVDDFLRGIKPKQLAISHTIDVKKIYSIVAKFKLQVRKRMQGFRAA